MPPKSLGTADQVGSVATEGVAQVNGIRLHYVEAGRPEGPLLILLHGFPETHRTWREQVPALAAQGFRVVAPDQRGYAPSDRPAGVRHYGLPELAEDVFGLMNQFGRTRTHVVGHDWGAAVAWWLALSRDQGRSFANVFFGTIGESGPIVGEWVDVPMGAGGVLSGGTLTLTGDQPATQISTTLTKTAQSATFGAALWTKIYDTRGAPVGPPTILQSAAPSSGAIHEDG